MKTSFVIDKTFPGVKELLATTFPEYQGNKFKLYVQDEISFDDTNWNEGSRTVYYVVTSTKQKQISKPLVPTKIPDNCIIVSQTTFFGKLLGIDFIISPNNKPVSIDIQA